MYIQDERYGRPSSEVSSHYFKRESTPITGHASYRESKSGDSAVMKRWNGLQFELIPRPEVVCMIVRIVISHQLIIWLKTPNRHHPHCRPSCRRHSDALLSVTAFQTYHLITVYCSSAVWPSCYGPHYVVNLSRWHGDTYELSPSDSPVEGVCVTLRQLIRSHERYPLSTVFIPLMPYSLHWYCIQVYADGSQDTWCGSCVSWNMTPASACFVWNKSYGWIRGKRRSECRRHSGQRK